MQLNVLDDLAEAMKALDGKKDGHVLGTLCAVTMALLTNRLDLCIQGLFGAFFPPTPSWLPPGRLTRYTTLQKQ